MNFGVPSMDSIGKLDLSEKYIVRKQLEYGQFGLIFIVDEKETKKKRALKMFLKKKIAQTDFIREYTYSYLLGAHPNIIDTYDGMYQTMNDEAFFFVQEVYPRANLQKLIDHKPGGLGEEITKLILLKVLSAMEYIHSKQLVHGNMKAENVLIFGVDTYTTVKVVDFSHTKKLDSLAKRIDEIDGYHAPEFCEILANEVISISLSLDMWALGILFFQCIRGHFPWEKATPICKPYREWDQWMKLKTHYIPRQFNTFTDKSMKILRKCLNPKPKERGTVEDMKRYVEKDTLIRMTKITRSKSYHGRTHSFHRSRTDELIDQERMPEKRKSSSFKRWINSAMNTMAEFSNQAILHDTY